MSINSREHFGNLLADLKQCKFFVFDVETCGSHFILATLYGIGFYIPENERCYYINLHNCSETWVNFVIKSLKPFFTDERIGKIGHNIIYDNHVMLNHNVEVKGPVFDTLVASYVVNPNDRPFRLKSLVPRHLKIDMREYKEIDNSNPIDLGLYCMEDCRCTYLLYKFMKKELVKNNLWRLFNDIEMPLLKVLFSMERVGFKVDVDKLSKMREVLENNAEKYKNEFCKSMFGVASDKVLIKVTKTVKKEKKKIEQPFNIDSNDHLGELFYNVKMYPALSKTKGGKPSTDKFALVKLAERGYEGLDLLLKYRQTTTLLKNFIRPILDDHMINGRVYPSYMQHVARTGRLSSSNPNFQNIPVRSEEGKEIRRCFIADEGYKIIDADLSQIEMRVMAHYSKDENLVKAYSQNLDLHDLTGQLVFGVAPGSTTDPKNKTVRTLCKNLNFGLQYGAGPRKFSIMANLQLPEGAKLTEDQAKEYIEKFFKSYPGIRMVQMQYPKQVRQVGYATTILGRRRYLPDITKKPYTGDKILDKENWKKTAKAEREAVSTLIQGTASDIIKLAMIKAHSKGILLVSQIHDELIAFSKNENVEQDVKVLKDCMENCGVTLIVPIVSNIDVSDVWNQSHIEEVIPEENDDEDLTN